MARYAVLQRSGANAAFVMGIARIGLSENGHAWVEVNGKPFEEAADVARYAVTFRYPPAQNSGKSG